MMPVIVVDAKNLHDFPKPFELKSHEKRTNFVDKSDLTTKSVLSFFLTNQFFENNLA